MNQAEIDTLTRAFVSAVYTAAGPGNVPVLKGLKNTHHDALVLTQCCEPIGVGAVVLTAYEEALGRKPVIGSSEDLELCGAVIQQALDRGFREIDPVFVGDFWTQ